MFKKITKTPVTPLPIDSNSFTASEWNSLNNEVYNLFKNILPEPDNYFTLIPTEAGVEDTEPFFLQSFDLLKSLDNDDYYYIDMNSLEYVPYNGDMQSLFKFKIYNGKKTKNNSFNIDDSSIISSGTPEIIKFYKFDIPLFLDSNGNPTVIENADMDITIESDDFIQNTNKTQKVKFNTDQYYTAVGNNKNDILLKKISENSWDYLFLEKESSGFDYSLEEYKYFEATKDTEQAFMIQRYPQYIGTYDTEYRLFIRSDYISNKHDIMELTNQMLIFGKADYQDAEYIDKQNPDDIYLSISRDAIRTNPNYYYVGDGDYYDDVLIPKKYVDTAIASIGELVITENLDMKSFNIVNLAEPVNLKDATTKKYVDDAIANNTGSFDYSLEEYKFTGYDDITSAVTIKTTEDVYYGYGELIYSLIFSPATDDVLVKTWAILNNTGLFLGKLKTPDFQGFLSNFDKTNDYINLVNYGKYDESYIELFNKPSNSKIKISGDYILGDANTKIINDYHFTTKKYVDEKIGVIFCSSRKLIQQNTNNKTLAGQSFYRPIDFCNILATGGYENSKSFTKQGNTNSVLKETNMVNGYQRQLVIGISFGHNNTMSSKKVECSVVLKRGDGTLVRGGNSMIFYDTQTRLQTSTTLTVTLDTADAFVSQGWYLEIQNLNDANDGGSVLTFSTIDILINVVQLPKLAGV
jgi:hypothetical protein